MLDICTDGQEVCTFELNANPQKVDDNNKYREQDIVNMTELLGSSTATLV